MGQSTAIHWMSPFPVSGVSRYTFLFLVLIEIRLWRLLWVCTVCLCPKKGRQANIWVNVIVCLLLQVLAFKTSFYFITNDFLYLLVSKRLVTFLLSMVKYKLTGLAAVTIKQKIYLHQNGIEVTGKQTQHNKHRLIKRKFRASTRGDTNTPGRRHF